MSALCSLVLGLFIDKRSPIADSVRKGAVSTSRCR